MQRLDHQRALPSFIWKHVPSHCTMITPVWTPVGLRWPLIGHRTQSMMISWKEALEKLIVVATWVIYHLWQKGALAAASCSGSEWCKNGSTALSKRRHSPTERCFRHTVRLQTARVIGRYASKHDRYASGCQCTTQYVLISCTSIMSPTCACHIAHWAHRALAEGPEAVPEAARRASMALLAASTAPRSRGFQQSFSPCP